MTIADKQVSSGDCIRQTRKRSSRSSGLSEGAALKQKRPRVQPLAEGIPNEDGKRIDPSKSFREMTQALNDNFVASLAALSKGELEQLRTLAGSEVFDSTVILQINAFLNILSCSVELKKADRANAFQKLMKRLHALLVTASDKLQTGALNEKIAAKSLMCNLRRIAFRALTQMNARNVQAMMVKYIKAFEFPSYKTSDRMLELLESGAEIEQLRNLALTWDKAYQLKQKYDLNSKGWNIPNQCFEVDVPDGAPISFFRFCTPDDCLNGTTPLTIYRAMLAEHDKMETRHMDLSLLRMQQWESEIERGNIRRGLQGDFPGTLIAWAFDFYSDFSYRNQLPHSHRNSELLPTELFFNEFMENLFSKENSPFKLPDMKDQEKENKKRFQDIFNSVWEDFFGEATCLSEKSVTAFIDITVICLIEHFCHVYKPRTCDTACFSHIDRGMAIMTVLYNYLLIKNDKHRDQEYLDYMEEMVFAPSLFFEQRPTHPDVMTRLQNTLSFMQSEEVVRKVQNRKTYFSDITLKIPEKISSERSAVNSKSALKVE